METSFTPLPPELRQVLITHGGEPLHLVDDQTQKVYLLIEEEALSPIDDDYLRKLIQEANEEVERGDIADWDIEEVKAEGRRLLAERRAKRKE